MYFVAIDRPSYDTARMRFALTLTLLCLLSMLPNRSDAFVVDQALSEQPPALQGEPLRSVAQQGGMSLAQAIESVRRRTNGRIVSAETRIESGREVHYIKVLTKDGKVKTHRVSGRSR